MNFQEFPKTPRLFRDVIVTEKIDGTNAQIFIQNTPITVFEETSPHVAVVDGKYIYAGSRTRWITPKDDNHGFAKWVEQNAEALAQLGEGRHFGEWWGSGIQRGYGLPKGEKRLSLFNTIRWCRHDQEPQRIPTSDPRIEKWQERLPDCVGLVPVLYQGVFNTEIIAQSLDVLHVEGSKAAPGFMSPEGVVVFHTAANQGFKVTLENDGVPKTKSQKP